MADPQQGSFLTRMPLWGKIAFGGVAVVLAGAVYFLFFDSEITTKIEREGKRTLELQAQLDTKRDEQVAFLADRDELTMRRAKQKDLNKALPEEAQTSSFLSAIQAVSNVSGVELKAWAPLEERTQGFYAKVPMKVEITGRFHQIAKFMYEMGRQDRIINMENVELGEPAPSGEDVVLKAKALATTFHLVKSTRPAAPEGAAPEQPAGGGQ